MDAKLARAEADLGAASSGTVNDASISPEQCRAARGLLDWSQDELSRRSGVSRGTVKKVEGGDQLSPLHARALRQTFEAAGCVFIGEGAAMSDLPVAQGVALRR